MKEERIIENPKIYAAIAGVIADCGIVGKDKVNKQQGFKYRSVDDVFNALHPALAKNKVVIIPTVVERQCEEVGKTKNGTAILKVICKVKYDICAEDGSCVTSIIYGEGMDMGDKKIENLQNMPNLATVDWESGIAQYQIPCRVIYFEKER